MAKWVLKDTGNEINIIKGKQRPSSHKVMYESDLISFKLCYNEQNRMTGYLLDYNHEKLHNKSMLFNYFCAMYNKEEAKKTPSLEVLYEDQVLRLTAYDHLDKSDRDYVLWGRWREETLLSSL